jgi:hypothetical protein
MSDETPGWIEELNQEDWQFIRRFILASGSLKELARVYSVSYPTLRARLDRLIAKVQAAEEYESCDPLERKIRLLVADGDLSAQSAKELLKEYRSSQKALPRNKEKKNA